MAKMTRDQARLALVQEANRFRLQSGRGWRAKIKKRFGRIVNFIPERVTVRLLGPEEWREAAAVVRLNDLFSDRRRAFLLERAEYAYQPHPLEGRGVARLPRPERRRRRKALVVAHGGRRGGRI